ncbi:hypothetical protein AWC27_14635 [Mycobacterium szulgai]|uniref:Thioesterase TesA n=1 Tax=Mycobacterium szulgai TaxID=1787 RepID=A0A1X2DIZ1_MYCSZ|nr:alpha/beta fold hydrolase [Mycobacterium szulgai]ORW88096.1 hypothetical protein AWC27_14635 [Mycobacterium szulgai]
MSAIELVCFPYAGGGAMSFNLLRRDLLAAGAGVNVTTVELPGRGIRREEARFVDAVMCARSLAAELGDLLCAPHVLLGHSMGALLAYLVAQERISLGLRRPEAVVAAAACAPHLIENPYDLDTIDDYDLALELASFGGLPVGLLSQPEWLVALMPAIRDDLRICQSYRRSGSPLPCPLHILGAYHDPLVPVDALAAWADYSIAPQPVRLFDGGHFLFQRANPDVVTAIADIADDALGQKEPAC